MKTLKQHAFAPLLAQIRAKRPLVHNITNFVVMNPTANALLAIGASPVMAHATQEVEDFAAMSGAVVINMGTLDAPFVAAMQMAARHARKAGTPWVFDPVGVGATGYRNEVAKQLAKLAPSVIRGNASEIMALAGDTGSGQGVDAGDASEAAIDAAKRLSAKRKTVVAVTGATDFVVDGDEVLAVGGGHALSQQITGSGCMTTALVGAFLAVALPRDAAIAALQLMKHAAEEAAKTARGPGSFAVNLIDALAAA